jgi:uncharacterized membrane protein (DUF485 family)
MAEPVKPGERTWQSAAITARNTRYGLILFSIYLLLYAAFMVINTFFPALMDWVPAAGVNLAVWYGFGLILAALILALVYAWLCRASAKAPANGEDRA